jgi:hypothetical protein
MTFCSWFVPRIYTIPKGGIRRHLGVLRSMLGRGEPSYWFRLEGP